MMKVLVGLLSLVVIAGVGFLYESVVEGIRWLRAYVHSRPRPSASPHANHRDSADRDNEEDVCN